MASTSKKPKPFYIKCACGAKIDEAGGNQSTICHRCDKENSINDIIWNYAEKLGIAVAALAQISAGLSHGYHMEDLADKALAEIKGKKT